MPAYFMTDDSREKLALLWAQQKAERDQKKERLTARFAEKIKDYKAKGMTDIQAVRQSLADYAEALSKAENAKPQGAAKNKLSQINGMQGAINDFYK